MATTTRKPPVRRSIEERKSALLQAKETHLKHVRTIDNKIAALSGKVTSSSMRDTSRKWLEAMSTQELKAHGERLGIGALVEYDDLDVLIEDCLNIMCGPE